MPVESQGPTITPELAQAVTRLGHLRRQLKQLETEEVLLRDRIVAEIGDWPKRLFPIKIGAFEVRLAERHGRMDLAETIKVLQAQHLLPQVPRLPQVRDAEAVERLGRELARLAMPEESRQQIISTYQAAIDFVPDVTPEWLVEQARSSRLTPEQYRACFKDQKPVVPMLTVRG